MRRLVPVLALLVLSSCGVVGGLRVEPTPPQPAASQPVAGAPLAASVNGFEVARTASATDGPIAVAYSPEAVWALFTGDTPRLARIDPRTGTEDAPRQPLPVDSTGLAVSSADGVWLSGNNRVFRVDPASGLATTSIPIAGTPERMLLAHGALLVLVSHPGATGQLESFDPTTGRPRWTATVGPGPAALTTWSGQVWVADRVSHDLRSVNEQSGEPGRPTPLPGSQATSDPVELSATRDALIVCLTDQLEMHLPKGPAEPHIPLGSLHALAFAASSNGFWILATTPTDPTPALYRVGDRMRPIRLGGDAVAIATGGGQVWVANRGLGSIMRIPQHR